MSGISQQITQIFETVDCGDKRLDRRVVETAQMHAKSPDQPFTQAAESSAQLEGCYRLMDNDRVTLEKLMAPQYQKTAQRSQEAERLRILHDTTSFKFGGEAKRQGVGRLHQKDQGFLSHHSLVVEVDKHPVPVGLIDQQAWTRDVEGREDIEAEEGWSLFENESDKWLRGVEAATRRLEDVSAQRVHIMDSGADNYEVFSRMASAEESFIIRSAELHRRVKQDKGWKQANISKPRLESVREDATRLGEKTISLSKRPEKGRPTEMRRKHPPRNRRETNVQISFREVTIEKSNSTSDGCPKQVDLNVVWVTEVDPPEDEPKMEWFLLTNQPIDKPEDGFEVVEDYDGRWLVEEFHKAIKTGCNYEAHRFENAHRLLNALGLSLPVAVELLRLRAKVRLTPNQKAKGHLKANHYGILVNHNRTDFEEDGSLEEALIGIAQLGGYLKHHDHPGWQVLTRGYEKLETLSKGAQLATVN